MAVIDFLLAPAVAAVWLGCLGFVRLADPLDRLHCAGFVGAVTGPTLALAAFLADGFSPRACKVLILVAGMLLTGALLSHVLARAIVNRGRS